MMLPNQSRNVGQNIVSDVTKISGHGEQIEAVHVDVELRICAVKVKFRDNFGF